MVKIKEIFDSNGPPTIDGWLFDSGMAGPKAEKVKYEKLEIISEILAIVGGREFADSLERMVSDKELLQEAAWVPYHGKRGGKGRKNLKTGTVQYGDFFGVGGRETAKPIGMADAFFSVLKNTGKSSKEVADDPELMDRMFAETKKNATLGFGKEHFVDFVKGISRLPGNISDEQRHSNVQAMAAAREVRQNFLSGVKSTTHAKALLHRIYKLTMSQIKEIRMSLTRKGMEEVDYEAQQKILKSIGIAALIVAGAVATGAVMYAGWKLLKKTPGLLKKTLRWLDSKVNGDKTIQESEEPTDKKDEERKKFLLDRLHKISDILYGVYGTNILTYLDELNEEVSESNIEEALKEEEIEEAFNGIKTITDKNGRRYEVEFRNGKPVKGRKTITNMNQKHAEEHPRTEYQLSMLANDLAQVHQKTQEVNPHHAAETIRLMAHVSPMQLEQLHHQFGEGVTKEQRQSVIKRIAKFAVKAGIVLAVTVPTMLALDYVGQKLIDKMPEGAFWMLMDDMSGSLKKLGNAAYNIAPKGIKVNVEGIKTEKNSLDEDKKEFEKWNAQPEWKKFLDRTTITGDKIGLVANPFFRKSEEERKKSVKEAFLEESFVPEDFSGLLEVLVDGEVRYRRYRNGVQIPLESDYRPRLA